MPPPLGIELLNPSNLCRSDSPSPNGVKPSVRQPSLHPHMMYILRQSEGISEDPNQHTWHVGGKKPRQVDGNCFNDVCELYADGQELVSVRRRCTNIPDVPSSGSMVWKGPFAQFIYDSLVYEHQTSMMLPPRPSKK